MTVHFFGNSRNVRTFDRLLAAEDQLPVDIEVHRYAAVFQREEFPNGTLAFTDFDLLHGFEIDMLSAVVRAARQRDPGVRILNDPAVALERTALLNTLFEQGLGPIRATRIDLGEMPPDYPVFIRAEDGCAGPDTGLLHTPEEFVAKREELRQAGLSLKRRIAVTYCAQPDADGFFRKYGAFVIGDRVIPQHVQRSTHWNVKSRFSGADEAFVAEEEAYLAENAHAPEVLAIARAAGIGFGRVDYTLIDGRPVAYEINTNPSWPGFVGGNPERASRRGLILERVAEALALVDTPSAGRAWTHFSPPMNNNHAFIERDPWFRHPVASLRRRRSWEALGRRLPWVSNRKPKRPPTERSVIEELGQ